MNLLEMLHDCLRDKILAQAFYNEQAIHVINPAARGLFLKFRDEEMAHIELLQREIGAIEARPFSVHKILPQPRPPVGREPE